MVDSAAVPDRAHTEHQGIVRRLDLGLEHAWRGRRWGAFMRAARSVAQTGTFDALSGAATFDELNAVFDQGPTRK